MQDDKTQPTSFAPAEPAPSNPPVENYVEALVGDDKKYKSIEDLAKGAFHAQTHIEKLEQERAREKAELEKAKTIEDILAAVDQAKASQSLQTPPQNTDGLNLGQGTQEATTSISEPINQKDIEETVKSLLQETSEKQRRQDNFDKSVRTLDARYGSRTATNQAVEARAQELGVSVNWLKDAAETTPQAFLKLMDAGDSQRKPEAPVVTPTTSSASGLLNKASAGKPKEGTYRYYQQVRRDNPSLYKKLYPEIMKQAQENPDAFYERG